MSRAIVIGASGLTGSALLCQLLEDDRFTEVLALTRRPIGVAHVKFHAEIVDFDRSDSWAGLVRGDVAFSSLGTTRKEAGSLAAQRIVDFDYQLAFARAAAGNGVPAFVLQSSLGADSGSKAAYPRMKGELDDAVAALPFARVRIIRPSFLAGERARPRSMEHAAIVAAGWLAGLGIGRQYRPIAVTTVARAMIASLFDGSQARRIYAGGEIFALGDRPGGGNRGERIGGLP